MSNSTYTQSSYSADKMGNLILAQELNPSLTSFEFADATFLLHGKSQPKEEEVVVEKYNLFGIKETSEEVRQQTSKNIEESFKKLREGKLTHLEISNIPDDSLQISLHATVYSNTPQWQPEDIDKVINAVRKACSEP